MNTSQHIQSHSPRSLSYGDTNKINESPNVTDMAAAASTIHNAQARLFAHSPHRGMQMNTNISISVANPIGIVARKRELVGSWIMTVQIPGYSAYRRIEMPRAVAKRTRLRTKNIMDR